MVVRPEDLAETMLRRARAEQAAYRKRADELRQRLPGLLATLLPKHRAWLIGSLDSENWGIRSDVDIVVEGLSSEEHASIHAELERSLATHVDLLRLESLDDSFRNSVLTMGKLIHVP